MLHDNFAYSGLMKYFEEISAIPRASYHEEKIAEYLCDFARVRGLEYYRDNTNNVLISAPASAGRENEPALLLQGHTDMVCEKNDGVMHDFDTDGLELYEEDGWIRARGTTLGADDGVAVAVMLYVLDGGVSSHPALECLFTSAEEVGLDGAKSFDYSKISARRMINMDGADETLILAGCAGGMRSAVEFPITTTKTCAKYVARLSVRGLFGGHSGEDINKGRANANILMGRVLYSLSRSSELDLIEIHGGTKDNAIPRECVALVATEDFDALRTLAEKLATRLQDGLCRDDAGFELYAECVSENESVEVIDRSVAARIVTLMHTVKNGIFEMNHDVKGLVEWSRNLGIVSCDRKGAELVFSSRSSFESRIDASSEELDDLAHALGATTRHYNRYPGWSYAPTSEVRDAYVSAFESIFGRKPEITVIHAGLECGFISEAVPDMDIISCGPVLLDLHSPDERLDKASFERFFTVIKAVIE
ncbi:MAG: aminoacyl-histidine dipeptidase [Ruminococcaceae bacterium]|nr:aminoacyl-histidine dipeptidase [Oscillospiraceae bacterium]